MERGVKFKADDGFPLTGTLFENQQETPAKPLVLISSAAAVPRGFYSHFARFLIKLGCRGVFTYDYRGLPGSPEPAKWASRINMIDWGQLDFPAAMKTLDAVDPGHPMVGIGHSYGGQALGISGCSSRFARYAAVATLSGYWRNTGEPWSVLFKMNGIGVPATWLFGKTPAWLGTGEPMPGPVFRDWARWCRSPRYFFDDAALKLPERFSAVETPILSLGFADDVWGTPKANAGLMDYYDRAPVEQLWLGPEDADGAQIGHLGFFRRRFADTLWPRLTDWLLDG
ncbi:alpha/beta hydrolase family protein [Oricola cellulosilytica]|uniref:Alpha/beta fold hydrolase n=1 Tax=Oricola cellulosilytica TaxID=1429082 RepID=A0A4R0P7W2_9HYPH|nr:alpha/beta fold hydrolase [Oricola cellulosilytica]TCD11969.1 alpha/beta fold hydrolase [Oricola cellulosilytica]